MHVFEIYISLYFLCCCFFLIKSNQNDIERQSNKNYFSKQKRSAPIVNTDEVKEKNIKQIIPDIEVIISNKSNIEPYKVFDEECHICAKETIVLVPVIEKTINIMPPCTTQACDLFEVQTKIVGAQEKTKIDYECCPGWTNTSTSCCMKPICKEECTNGEVCVKPDTCKCPEGIICKKYFGICEILKPCDHLCFNTESSFICLCKPGFNLGPDRRQCIKDDKNTDDNHPLEARDMEQDDDNSSCNYRFEKVEKMIENNKRAASDLNKKLQIMFNVTDFLNTRINVLENKTREILNMEERIESNEKNMEKFMKFANELWSSSKDIFKKNLINDDDHDNDNIPEI